MGLMRLMRPGEKTRSGELPQNRSGGSNLSGLGFPLATFVCGLSPRWLAMFVGPPHRVDWRVSRLCTNAFLGCGFRENSADSNFPGPTLSLEVGSFQKTESASYSLVRFRGFEAGYALYHISTADFQRSALHIIRLPFADFEVDGIVRSGRDISVGRHVHAHVHRCRDKRNRNGTRGDIKLMPCFSRGSRVWRVQ
jgi:hypothetical protein